MLSSLSLDGEWKVRGFDYQHGGPQQYYADGADERTFIPAQVPGEIHLDLMKAGWIEDYNIAMNAQAARWVEEQVWLYRKRFTAPSDALNQKAWLVFEGLDLAASVYLNGELIGTHENAFVPCRLEVTGMLRAGENLLAVEVESGLYCSADKPGAPYNPGRENTFAKRAWLRKPQYSFSWDWSPRLINVGIFKPARLEWADTARIDAVTVLPELSEDHRSAVVNARVFVENVKSEPVKAAIRMRAVQTGAEATKEIELPVGVSRQDLSLEIRNPELWWPIPHGKQNLYNFQFEVQVNGQVADRAERRTGIRSIRINTDPHPDRGEYFILEVNGRPVFAKGGNWVPCDSVYGRPDRSRYRKLVQLAVESNFNALRIWGGGLYADHHLLDACDEMGVLVWHDFIFACAKYPSDDPAFLENVRQEVTFNVRDLSHHPSLLVWCGNNELEWGAWDWGFDRVKAYPDYALYHHEIPRIVKREDPSRPYWPSSPYSTGNRYPNDPTTGDQHPWHVTLQEDGPNFWAYRSNVSRFPNEGGVLGATGIATLRQCLPKDQQCLFSPSWEFHDNACNFWSARPVTYQAVEYWLGIKPEEMRFEDYVFYSGVLQAEGLQEYSNNFRRRMFSTSSAIFWMYNDSWPASHGWTIVDYYLRKKLAYHPVRRAFAPVHVIPVIEGDKVVIYGVNDNPHPFVGEARYGIFNLAGGLPVEDVRPVNMAANAATVIGSIPLHRWSSIGFESSGAFGVLYKDGKLLAQNRIFNARFKDLNWSKANITIKRRGDAAVFSADSFAWAVTLDQEGEKDLADDVFDIIPGIDYEIAWPEGSAAPAIQRAASPIEVK